ncbi:MAG: endonuclease MutS2 [Deltaproteobacteria bacterium]|nr:endonuclease MutS2 [Deltaproteobacteria bacterium]
METESVAPRGRPGACDSGDAELEWGRIVEAVAERAVGPLRERPRVPVHATRELARAALARTAEALSLQQRGERLPLTGWPDLSRQLARLSRHGDLDGEALRQVLELLAAARVLRLFLSRHREHASALRLRLSTSAGLDGLEELLASALEPDGSLRSRASADLSRLRTEVANLRGRLVRRLEGMLESRGAILQERYYTEREGRYVLPVRADAHERLHGIVHATSATGATLFIEPRELVEAGNRLKMARAEMQREELRILAMLSQATRDQLPDVEQALEVLDEADLVRAAAQLCLDLEGVVPELDEADVLELRDARHPLLVLDGVRVVPNSLRVAAGQALLLSGPNAGGKTVALKTLGLAALMARAGLPIAAAEGSRVGFFPVVRTDLGDHQSTQQNLSTFSAHISHVASILEQARPGALVLLDELAGGTDPEEGAALATAIVLELCERGAATVTTTHYPALKALGAKDARVTNAAVAFDVETMRPTFRLELGLPGASCALPVARRFGLPQAVVERAQACLPESRRAAETLALELARLREQAVRERDEEQAARLRAQSLLRDAEEIEARARRQAAGVAERELAKLRGLFREARRELESARRRLREAGDDDALREAAERLVETEGRLPRPAPRPTREPSSPAQSPPVEASELVLGARVWAPELRRVATIVELGGRGRVRVLAGSLKCWVDAAGLRRDPDAGAKPGREASSKRAHPRVSRAEDLTPRGDGNSLDLRGLRVDDALALAETFLDRLYGEDVDVAYLLHGHGGGALRRALRERLAQGLPTVRAFGPGAPEEGGDALTVVTLR